MYVPRKTKILHCDACTPVERERCFRGDPRHDITDYYDNGYNNIIIYPLFNGPAAAATIAWKTLSKNL